MTAARPAGAKITKTCTLNGKKLYGKVKVVQNFADFKVKTVRTSSISRCSSSRTSRRLRQVAAGRELPDFTIQYVENFPDFQIKNVEHFPGVP